MQQKLTSEHVFVWDQWVVWRLGGRPAIAALIVATLLFASFLLLAYLTGGPPLQTANGGSAGVDSLTWAALVTSLFGGYAIAVTSFVLVNDEADMRALAPLIGEAPEDFIGEWHAVQAGNTKRGWLYSFGGWVVGVAVMFVAVPGASELITGQSAEKHSAAAHFWLFIVVPVIVSLLAKGIFYSWIEERFGRDVRGRGLEVDLFDLEKLAPLTRMALRRSFVWIVGATIGSLYFLSSGLDRALFTPFFAGIAGIAGVTLFMPLFNAHRSIRDMKAQELRRIRSAIMRARDAAFGNGSGAQEALARLPGLIALEARIDAAREWPVDISTAGRFSLYLAIPLGSWIGGALMEKAVDFLF